ncbi:DUF6678 family protein [Hymenobacter actinosclerus]|uniref:Uncharacterized protein n=1 Tax=Hymenobacter actinosclerus TaxID=82805 RepID=A0A1I0A9J2_9BACT|nr:DUF6678 family protein [Hymenobacter actinosclerus]SES90799.1 hypothetical protein SAMN04487998_0635 [Hymenobacter actinosclerus]
MKKYMKRLIILQKLIEDTKCKVRLKPDRTNQITDWRGGFGIPVEGYIEVAGPERIADVEWIELDPIVVTHIGRLVPPHIAFVSDAIREVLNKELVEFDVVKGMIRIDGSQLR